MFSKGDEGGLVRRLRDANGFVEDLSIVAERRGEIIGYIVLIPVTLERAGEGPPSLLLAPLAVAPEYQGRAVGSRLVEFALDRALQFGYGSVFVLGHPAYYPRFGFKPASGWGISPPCDVPGESFMVLELVEGALGGVSGTLDLPPAFSEM